MGIIGAVCFRHSAGYDIVHVVDRRLRGLHSLYARLRVVRRHCLGGKALRLVVLSNFFTRGVDVNRHRKKAARGVILVQRVALGGGNGGQQAKLVVSVRLDLLARLVRRQHVVGLVIGAANQSVSCSVIRNFL